MNLRHGFIPYLDLNGENIEMTNFWSSLNIHFGQDTRKNKLLYDMALHAENPKRPEPLHYKIEADDELWRWYKKTGANGSKA